MHATALLVGVFWRVRRSSILPHGKMNAEKLNKAHILAAHRKRKSMSSQPTLLVNANSNFFQGRHVAIVESSRCHSCRSVPEVQAILMAATPNEKRSLRFAADGRTVYGANSSSTMTANSMHLANLKQRNLRAPGPDRC